MTTLTGPEPLAESPSAPTGGPEAAVHHPACAQVSAASREFHARLEALAAEISLPENFRIRIRQDEEIPGGRWYFQIEADRVDTFTGLMGTGHGGKAYLSPHATNSELIQTVFGLYKSYLEHEARETFLYRGRRVFGPHIDTHALWEVAERYDARPLPETR